MSIQFEQLQLPVEIFVYFLTIINKAQNWTTQEYLEVLLLFYKPKWHIRSHIRAKPGWVVS